MTIAEAFADIAAGFSAAGLGAFHDATIRWPGTAVYDAGGSISTPGDPVEKSASVQVDAATEAMRAAEGFVDGDVRILVLAASLDGEMDTGARITIADGAHAGAWLVASVSRDPAGVYWECRGRRA